MIPVSVLPFSSHCLRTRQRFHKPLEGCYVTPTPSLEGRKKMGIYVRMYLSGRKLTGGVIQGTAAERVQKGLAWGGVTVRARASW